MAKKKPTLLKHMDLNSVDFVRRGANPDAHIMIKKSYDSEDDDVEKQPFFKTLVAAIKKAISGEEPEETEMDIQKSADDMQYFTDCLAESYDSIMGDTTLTKSEKIDMIAKSTNEFTDTMEDYLSSVSSHVGKSTHDAIDYPLSKNNSEGGYETMGINLENVDKSLLTSDEAAQLDALIAKACKTQKADENNLPDESSVQASEKKPPFFGKKPTEGENPDEGEQPTEKGKDETEVEKALREELKAVQDLRKSMEMKEYMDIAKKYESIGKKPEELAKTLYDMKQAGEEVYKSYVDALDEQVSIVEKSGLFVELGKSGSAGLSYVTVGKSEAEGKIEALAAEIRKSDASIGYHESIAKAWEQNPDLVAAYDEAYKG